MELTEEEKNEALRLLAKRTAESNDLGGCLGISDLQKIAAKMAAKKWNKIKDDKADESDDQSSALSTHAREIHMSSVLKIHKLIDKVEKNVIEEEPKLSDSIHIEMPDLDCLNFSLGDKVVISISKERFKFMQSQTVGWRKVVSNLLGQIGFISELKSKHACKAQVYFPNILTSTPIYIGALTKTEQELPTVPSRWKVGDYVTTMTNALLVKKFQKRLPDLPEKYIGKKGRVIAVTNAGIFTTFNDKSSYPLNAGLLHRSEDTFPIQPNTVTDHPKNFKVGDRVRVIRDIRELFENQKGSGGWNWKMCALAGNIVTICHIKKDGSLMVATKHGKTWRLSYESAFFDPDATKRLGDISSVGDLPFLPGDLVRLKLSENIKVQLLEAKVLESCIDLLKSTARVEGIDHKYDVVIRFDNGMKKTVKPSMITKVSKLTERHHKTMKAKREPLTVGGMVRLAIGPVRYARDIISKIKMRKETFDALTGESELLGYVDVHHAVIRYNDGRKIKMNRKYLEPAARCRYRFPQNVGFDCLRTLVGALQSGLAAVKLSNVEESRESIEESVEIYSVTSGTPPTVCIRIDSSEKQDNILIDLKKHTGWTISEVSLNECSVRTIDGIEFDLILTSEVQKSEVQEYTSESVDCMMELLKKEQKKTEINEEIKRARRKSDVKAEPFSFSRQNSRINDRNTAPPSLLSQQNLGDFKFLSFHTAGGSFYFPYLPDASQTLPCVESQRKDVRGRASNNVETNIIVQGNVGSINQNI